MKGLKISLMALVAVLIFTFSSYSQTAGVKIGVVDVTTIVKEMPEAVEADGKLQKLRKNYQDTLMNMQNQLEDRFKQYQKQKAMMPADQQQKEEESLNALNMQILQYREQIFGVNGTLANTGETMMDPIRKKIKAAIEKVAKDEKMNFVLDKGSSTVLYSEDKLDITYKVLDHIKRGEK